MNTSITNISNRRNNLPEHNILAKNNIRVEFKQDADDEATITQENHYYPFGMRFSGEVFANNDNDFRYNGKELQDDFGLDWPRFQRDCLSLRIGEPWRSQSLATGEYDYGAGFYDQALGRWHAVDPLADKAPGWTPYRYGFNNPMSFIDPDGRAERKQSIDSWLDDEDDNYSSVTISGGKGMTGSITYGSNPSSNKVYFINIITGATEGTATEYASGGFTDVKLEEGKGGGEAANGGDVRSFENGDGYITYSEAYWTFRLSEGKVDLFADLDKLNLSKIKSSDFPGGVSSDKAFNFASSKYYTNSTQDLVYGNVTLRLLKNNKVIAHSDTYDFNIISKPNTFLRDVLTIWGHMYNGPGTPFKIHFRGTATIGDNQQ